MSSSSSVIWRPIAERFLVAILGIALTACGANLKVVVPGTILTASTEAGEAVRVRVDAVDLDPLDAEGETYLYTISVEDEEARQWQSFCAPDSENVAKAIPLAGYWDDSGKYFESDTRLTLACTSGVIAKCVRWGYKPWKTLHGGS